MLKNNWLPFSEEILRENIHFGLGYFLLLSPVDNYQQSWKKSKSSCFHFLLTNCYSTSRRIFFGGNGLSFISTFLLREPKLMFGRVSIDIIKLGKRLEIQLVILVCPAFRGQKFRGKRELCGQPARSTSYSLPHKFTQPC